jgi:hypothetical protein
MSALGTVENLKGKNLKINHMINKKIGLMALLASFATSEILASNTLTNYSIGDVLVCFANGGSRNMVVDAGPISTFTNASNNQRISIPYTSTQFNVAFGGVDGVDWSAFTWFDGSVSPASAQWSLFMTKERVNLNNQTTPWSADNGSFQQSAAQCMSAIPIGALYNLNFKPANTSQAIIEPQSANNYPAGKGQSYINALYQGLSFPNFGGNFSGDPEITTPDDFDSSGTVVRSDFYQIPPGFGTANVTYLGYFEMATDGTMTFVAKPTAVPVVQSISRSNNVSTITYITGTYGTYTLRGTNSLNSGTSPTNWPAISILPNGTTSSQTVNDTDSSPNKFYIITAQ